MGNQRFLPGSQFDHLLELTKANRASLAGVRMAQSHSALYWFEKILQANDIESVYEIGTANGSLTLLFGLAVSKVVTVDVRPVTSRKIRRLFDKLGIQFVQLPYDNPAIAEQIIKDDDTKLIFCDNGEKEKEFKYFAQILKRNDIIMVHDNGTEFMADSDINIMCAMDNDLERIYKDDLDRDCTLLAAWRKK